MEIWNLWRYIRNFRWQVIN